MTDEKNNLSQAEGNAASASATSSDLANSPAKIILCGHDGPDRDHAVDLTSGEDAFSMNVLDGEAIFTSEYLKAVTRAAHALIVIDPIRGVDELIRAQCMLLHRFGLTDLMALTGAEPMSKTRFDEIARDLNAFSAAVDIANIKLVPLVMFKNALSDDDESHPVFSGDILGQVQTPAKPLPSTDFRLAVTAVSTGGETIIEGTLLSGQADVHNLIVALPSSETAEITRIVIGADGLIILHLASSIKIESGQLIALAEGRPEIADQVRAKLYWSSETPMLSGRPYIIELAGQTADATITDIRFKESFESAERIAAKRLHQGDLGEVNLSFDKDLAFDPFAKLPQTGMFRLCDKTSGVEVGTGFVLYGLRRATNIHRQAIDIDAEARAAAKGQKACCIWFTGLSGSGKSTIANALETRLHQMGRHTYILDGDNVRHGLNRDLGFTDADRVENIRRIGEVAKLMVDSGLIVMTAFISPFRSERRLARDLFSDGQFIEIFVDTSLDVCETRDPKGLYKKARAGEIANFTGIDSVYETPESAELAINAGSQTLDKVVDRIVETLLHRDMLANG